MAGTARPTRRERFRPLELVLLAAALGGFTAVVVLVVTRQPDLAGIFGGIAFIAGLLGLAMLALAAGGPDQSGDTRPLLERRDPQHDDGPGQG